MKILILLNMTCQKVLWDVESDGTTESFWWSCEVRLFVYVDQFIYIPKTLLLLAPTCVFSQLVADGHDVNDQGRVVCTLKVQLMHISTFYLSLI